MAVANKLAPELNLGFDTLTAFPQSGSGGVTVDGYIGRYIPSGETFAAMSSNSSGTYGGTNDNLWIYSAAASGGNFSEIDRTILTFDTSAINPISTVQSATLSLVPIDIYSGLGTTPLHLTAATPAQPNDLRNSDYSALGTTSFANASAASMTVGTYFSLTLNAAGLANITKGGISEFGLRLGWDLAGSFAGTYHNGETTYYELHDAETGGTSADPRLVVTYTGVRATTPAGSLLLGGSVTDKTTHVTTISGSLSIGATINLTKQVAPVAGKQWLYRIYDQNMNYIGVWKDDINPPDFTQQINTPGTTMQVKLPRNAFTTIGARADLTADDGTIITTDDGYNISVQYITRNTVGPNTDVDLNYFVDVYAYYGGFDTLSTDSGQIICTDDGNDILIPIGAPLGRCIFSGWIMDYSATYGDSDELDITLASNGSELSNQVINQSGTTTVSYTAVDHGTIIRSLLSMNSGKMTYTAGTVALTGLTASPTYQLNTVAEGLDDVFNLSPPGWYWYGNVADNNVYFQQASSTAKHTFILGTHINALTLSKTLVNLKNVLYFVGGDTGSSVYLYDKFSTSSATVNRVGLDRPTDRRIKTTAEAQLLATKLFARYKEPIWTSRVTIPSEVYDIESVQLGDTITFGNFGNFVDGLLLTVTNRHYTGYTVELEVGEILPSAAQIINGINTELARSTYQTIPTSPTSTIVL
jgi:hypothetical protein